MDIITPKVVAPTTNPQNVNLKPRQFGLTGTDVATLLGINPFKSPLILYVEKITNSESSEPDMESVALSQLFVNPVAHRYEGLREQKLTCSSTVVHQEHPFLIDKPQRIILDCPPSKVLAIKVISERYHLCPEDHYIPAETMQLYMVQMFHSMLVTNCASAELIIGIIPKATKNRIFGRLVNYAVDSVPINLEDFLNYMDFYRYTFFRDNEIEEIIIEGASYFWEKHIEKKCPPPVEYAYPALKELLRSKFNSIAEEKIKLPVETKSLTTEGELPIKGEASDE